MLKQIAAYTACAISMAAVLAQAGESGSFKGHGTDLTSIRETKMANGTTVLLVEQRSVGWIDEGKFAPGHLNGTCRGVGTLDAAGAYKGDIFYCTYLLDDKTAYTIKILDDTPAGGNPEIIGGTGALAGAIGKCQYSYVWGAPQGDSSKWVFKCNYTMP